MKNSKRNTLAILLAIAGTSSGQAAVKPIHIAAVTNPKFPVHGKSEVPPFDSVALSQEEFDAESRAALDRAKRSVAGVTDYEAAMSPQLKDLRTDLSSVGSASELDVLLEKLNTNYEAVDASYKQSKSKTPYAGPERDYLYFAAEILPLRCLKGFTYRFTPLAEDSKVVDSRLVSSMYRLANDIQIFSPRPEDLADSGARAKSTEAKEKNISRAAFDYVSLPYDNAVLFASGDQLQSYLMNFCYADLEKSAARIRRLDLKNPIVWDNKMFFGVGTFSDSLDRYKLIGEAEKHFSLAMKYIGMHAISFFRSYTITSYFKLQMELARLSVDDAFSLTRGFTSVDGVDLEKRRDVINRFGDTFVRYDDGAEFMKLAYFDIARAVQELSLTWKEVKDKPNNSEKVFNPAFLKGFERGTSATLEAWLRLTRGSKLATGNNPQPFKSRLTDQIVTVDLESFYFHPPYDLKSFLPTGFEQEKRHFLPNSHKSFVWDTKKNENVAAPSRFSDYRNYYYRQPNDWNPEAYKLIFPDLNQGSEVPAKLRALNQSWGGGLVALPVLSFFR